MWFVKMKVFFILLVCFLVSSHAVEIPADLQDFIDDLHDSCVSKSGVTDDEHSTYDIESKDPKMMDYMKCLMMESKWMTPSGEIQYQFIEDSAHPKIKNVLLTALDKCRSISDGDSLNEKAYNFNYCMYKADPVNWFFV